MVVASQTQLLSEYRDTISSLSTVFYARLVELVERFPNASKEEMRKALIEAFPALLTPFAESSADVGAVFYEASRSSSVGGRFSASPVRPVLDPGAVDGLVRYAVSPLYQEAGMASVTSILAGAGQRHIANAGRDSIRSNVGSDPVAYGYARKPAPGCCEFCAMLSTRVYSDEGSVLRVVGRRGGKTRGSQNIGDKYHDYCNCEVVPVFGSGEDYHEDIISVNPDAEKYIKAYADAYEMSADAEKGKKTNAVLANMRQLLGL